MYLWCLLAALRIALVFLPQTGYIHPDEFFQSTEIAAGDVFDLQTHRAWEFTDERPVRSAAVVHLTAGLPLVALRCLLRRPPSAYLLLVVPRLFLCMLSFVCDYAAYRACVLGRYSGRCTLLLASSYVALVYYGRTFSNTVESFLLALLFLTTVVDETRRVWIVSAIVALGIFNRPTFAVFALPSVVHWIFRCGDVGQVLRRAFLLSRSCLVLAAALVLVDTLYYVPETLAEVSNSLSNLRTVVSPVNFVRYNLDVSNLRSHGLHPRWLHLVVNVPILFNVAGAVSLWSSVRILTDASVRRDSGAVDVVCASTISLSVAFFSLFRHQEPRFLLPLLVPVAVLSYRRLTASGSLVAVWIVCNVLCLLFFGFVHQGGVVPCLLRLRPALKVDACKRARVVFLRTYMPPRHLLAIPKACKDVEVVDLAGGSTTLLSEVLTNGTIVVTPGTPSVEGALGRVGLRRLFRCFPHFSGDDPPKVAALLESFWKGDVETALRLFTDRLTLHVFEVLELGGSPKE